MGVLKALSNEQAYIVLTDTVVFKPYYSFFKNALSLTTCQPSVTCRILAPPGRQPRTGAWWLLVKTFIPADFDSGEVFAL
jgi:hypothetical protein